MKVLLLENIHQAATERFIGQGIEVESIKSALGPDELKRKLEGVQVLGIRSKTQLNEEVLSSASDLIAIGCFCIGTNQVDLEAATKKGIAVFNAPFGNTRSVAELILSEIIGLSRQVYQKSHELHKGIWNKSSNGCYEVRGKKLGIVGYGNIGSQLSFLAETLGMQVYFYDIATKLPLGNAKSCESLTELLQLSDFVTLHVPATPETHNLISSRQLESMKKGAFLLNASRGNVVDLPALAAALRSKHLAGAAIDVFPEEPEANGDGFRTVLQGIDNVILTPHIGGATEEAQSIIGKEVSLSLTKYLNSGCTTGSVSFPILDAGPMRNRFRTFCFHKNKPGVLREVNRIVSQSGLNISTQLLATRGEFGYLIFETDTQPEARTLEALSRLEDSIRIRGTAPLEINTSYAKVA